MKNYPYQDAQETTIYVIEDNEIVEKNKYDFIMESIELTTSPRGVESKLFIEEDETLVYIHNQFETQIDEYEYDDLSDDDKQDYQPAVLTEYCVIKWQHGGKRRNIARYKYEEEAINHIYESVRDYDFQGDCNRSTHYEYYYEDAYNFLIEDLSYNWNTSIETTKHIYRKMLLLDEYRLKMINEKLVENERILKETAVTTKENIVSFIKENYVQVKSLVDELDYLKENNQKEDWQIKANSLIQKVSKNDFRVLKWKDIYNILKEETKES